MNSEESYSLAHFDVGARYHFTNPSRALVPYLEAALTGRAAVQENVTFTDDQGNTTTGDLSLSGTGFSFGGGVLYFLNSKWALNGALKWTTGEFSTVKFGDVSVSGLEADATTARVNLGISWFPKGG